MKFIYTNVNSYSLLHNTFLNKHFGEHGWELVNIITTNENLTNNTLYIYTFKKKEN